MKVRMTFAVITNQRRYLLWPAIDAALGHRLTGPPLRHSWPLTLPKLSIASMVALLMA